MNITDYDNIVPDIVYFNHRKCTPDWRIEESVIDFTDVTYVVRGTAMYTIDQIKMKVSAGDLVCIPAGSRRSALSDPADLMECYAANFQLRTLAGQEVPFPLPLLSHIGQQAGIITLYKDLNVEWLCRDPGHRMKVRAFFLLILQRYLELIVYKNDSGMVDTRIRKAIRYITDHYAEPLSIRDLAEPAGLNPVYFGALFKQSTGMSFRQYLTSIRLNQAENMLRAGEHNVNEISQHCGFSDIFYFSKVFKESRGVSPSKLCSATGTAGALRR
jgi:AraC-like DNA-binding protein